MRASSIVSLVATILPLVYGQNFVPTAGSSSFPACAVGCDVLMKTQSLCTPPNAITSTQTTYESCFCQAPYVQDLYTTGETLCTSQCTSATDRQLLSTWFVGLCKQVGLSYDAAQGGAVPTTLTTSTMASATTSTAQQTGASTVGTPASSSASGPWIKTHWQWIIMLIFLFFGLLGLGFGAKWLKQRHDRKMDLQRAAMSDSPDAKDMQMERDGALTPDALVPHQHMGATKGHQYAPTGVLPIIDEDAGNNATNGKEKISSRVEVTEIQPVPAPVHSKTSRFRLS